MKDQRDEAYIEELEAMIYEMRCTGADERDIAEFEEMLDKELSR
jgi:hypothetical protein